MDDRLHEDQRGLHTTVNKRVLLIHTASPGSSSESSNGDLPASSDACATAYLPGVGAGGGPTSPVTGLPSPGFGNESKLKLFDARCGVVDLVGGGNRGEGIGDARGDDSSSTMIASKSAFSSSSREGLGEALGDTRGEVPGPHASKRAPRWWSSVRGEVAFFLGVERFFFAGDGDGRFGGGEKNASTPEGASTSPPSTSARWGVSKTSTAPQVGPFSESSETTWSRPCRPSRGP